MKLRSLALNQFRKFTTTTRLDDIGDGLNIIGGPNEMGKSTLLAALRSVLFEKYNSKARPIRELQNARNKAAPVVVLEFELEEGIYRISKRFVKGPYARLQCPDGRDLQGDEAEEALRTLLNFNEPNNVGAKPESLGIWNVLWVQQGDSFGLIDMPDSARSSLHGALDSQVGAVLGGKRGRELPRAIQNRLNEQITPSTGRPRGEYKALGERVGSLEEELNQLKERRRELSEDLENLEEVQVKLDRIDSGENEQKDEEDLEASLTRRDELKTLESKIEKAKLGGTLLQTRRNTAQRRVDERKELRSSISEREESLSELNACVEQLTEEKSASIKSLERALSSVRQAEKLLEKLDESEFRQRRIVAAGERHSQLQEWEDRFSKAEKAEKSQRKFERAAAEILVTEETLDAIRQAEKQVESAASRLNAAATRIDFELKSQNLPDLTVNGDPLTDSRASIRAVETTKILIPGRGTISIEPAIRDREKLLAEQRDNSATLKQNLIETGVANPDEAESQFRRKQQLLRDAKAAREEVELYAPAAKGREAGVRALGTHIEALRRILEKELKKLDLKTLPALGEAETQLRETATRTSEMRTELATKREATSGPEQESRRVETELARIQGTLEESVRILEADKRRLEAEEKDVSDAALHRDTKEVQLSLKQQDMLIETLESQRDDQTISQLEARISRLQRAIDGRRNKREELGTQKARLESRIEVADGAGLDEKIDLVERNLILAQEELGRKQRDVAVLNLLLETLRNAESLAKEKYLTPVMSRIRPYLESLFPGAEILIDENLVIKGLRRGDEHDEQFHHLSMGTQEQIAVLVRLAFAKMLAEQGNPATVVLDDALVFSDDQRMERMFDILNMAADDVQVLILTCREQLFERLGGKVLSLETSDVDELVSA